MVSDLLKAQRFQEMCMTLSERNGLPPIKPSEFLTSEQVIAAGDFFSKLINYQ